MQRLVIVGGGFAGVWAALGAADVRRRHGYDRAELDITLVSRDPWLTIRPRLYEATLEGVRVPLDMVLEPAGVARVQGEVTTIDTAARTVAVRGVGVLTYDRLVMASGSRLDRPSIPGAERVFAVDSYAEAMALDRHLASAAVDESGFTAVVVGAGFAGIEVATELVGRLRAIARRSRPADAVRVVLVERASVPAPDLGADARRHVEQSLSRLGIELRLGASVASVESDGVTLSSGERIPARTTIWTCGFRASPLAAQLPVEHDALGRVHVDGLLRVRGVQGVFAAGDVAHAMADATHVSPMSCQLAVPMGESAGRNAAAELLAMPAAPWSHPHYVTCLDLGEAGALFMEGWDRDVKLTGFWGKLMKETINRRLIYPPRERRARDAPPEGDVRSAA